MNKVGTVCRSCGAAIRWEPSPKTGKPVPISLATGLSHFADCPDAGRWSRKKDSPAGPGPGGDPRGDRAPLAQGGMLHGVPASGWYGRPDTQLRTDEAHRYARLLHAALGRHWRVEVFHVAQGIATVELRARQRPPRPAVVLRQAGECERVLREGIASRFQSSPGV